MVNTEMADGSPSPHEAPTPQCVGREFVRQYYTLMAEAPHFLYRFYSNQSIFVHGSDEEIIGQTAIQKKVAALGFQDCRTRILVLDSHETIGKGVVVQVVGDITINGDQNAMRRFVQTFVLAPQSEKKYYVYNDIFRYEDSFKDGDKEKDFENVPDPPTARPLEQRPPRVISNGGTHTSELGEFYPSLPNQQSIASFQPSGQINENRAPSTVQAAQPGYHPPPLPQRNAPPVAEAQDLSFGEPEPTGTWSESTVPPLASSVPFGKVDAQQQQYAQSSQQQTAPALNASLPSQSPVPSTTAAPQSVAPLASDHTRAMSAEKQSPENENDRERPQQRESASTPRYWADICKNKGSQAPSTGISSAGHQPMIPPGQQVMARPPMELQQSVAVGAWNDVQQQGFPNPKRDFRPPNPAEFGSHSQDARASPAPSGGGGSRGRANDIPVEEGVFIRNIPLGLSEEQLKNLLADQGAEAIEIRIVPKEFNCFAFVHLSSTESVQHLLKMHSLKIEGGEINFAQMRRNDGPYGGRSVQGAGHGSGSFGPGIQRGRGSRGGNSAQRGGGDRGAPRGGRGVGGRGYFGGTGGAGNRGGGFV